MISTVANAQTTDGRRASQTCRSPPNSDQMLAVSQAFDLAVGKGKASYGLPPHGGAIGRCVTPTLARKVGEGRVQVGGLGVLEQARDFDTFPVGSIGRLFDEKGQ